MKAVRFVASLAIIAGVIALYRTGLSVNNTTVALSLLLAVLGISAGWGLAEATAASVLAVLGFNYFFLPPVGGFTIRDPQNWAALLAFLVTAVTASQLSARARRRTAEAEARRQEIERLYALVQTMMLSGNARKTVRGFVHAVVKVFGCAGAAVYYRPTEEFFRSGPESNPASDHELLVTSETEEVAVDASRAVALAPVRLGMRPTGSLALVGAVPSAVMVQAIANLLALTIEKARALEDVSQAEATRQGEALKSALLDSLAHDIKTPLTSIKAAVTGLLAASPAPPDRELLTIINEEADRLNGLAAEVVEMARIEAGKLHLEKQPVSVDELVAAALSAFAPALKERPLTVRVPGGLPAVEVDPEFAGQVIKQFVENALKYTPPGSPLEVSAGIEGGKIVIGVADHGPGLDPDERARVFDKFFRGRRHRFETKGTGMGLAIAKGIVEAHGERIWVESVPGHGAVFYFSLPPAAAGSENGKGGEGREGPNL
jgi:two-component system, OmpR family, sensor histidine kinase KdpD